MPYEIILNQKVLSQKIWLLSLISVVTASPSTFFRQSSKSGRYCFSCMSKDFEAHWSYLEEIYYRPMNFTDTCHAMRSGSSIGQTPCSHSICVTVIEPRILAGQYIGNNVIRGCFSSVFKHGEVPMDNLVDTSCSEFPMRRLLPKHLVHRSNNRTVEMCRCLGNLCNDYPWAPVNSSQLSKNIDFYKVLFIALITCLPHYVKVRVRFI